VTWGETSARDDGLIGEAAGIGTAMHRLIADLHPICRSITGDGVRQTLAYINERIPITLSEVPTGTAVFDWTIPKEWNIRDAYIKNSRGDRVVDFQRSNLHVVNYSAPIRAMLSLAELKPHLYSIPEHCSWIPYRTSYYTDAWGFCVSHDQLAAMTEDQYEVCIDSSLADGHLTYGECWLPGETADEVLISCHVCHPSLCNDNLSGISVATFLANTLLLRRRRYSYRFLFIPGTIGAIAWLARQRDLTARIKHGLVLTCVGDAGGFHYKKSRRGDADIDQAVAHVLRHQQTPHEILEFSPYGYDERQFCSPGFNLPVGCLMRSVWGQFPEYHSSADDLDFVKPEALAESLSTCLAVVDILEHNRVYRRADPYCEPALGRRGLYSSTGASENLAKLWVLNLADGSHTLLAMADRAGLSFTTIRDAARELLDHGLLIAADDEECR
jgi:aminopeptidase-like protein